MEQLEFSLEDEEQCGVLSGEAEKAAVVCNISIDTHNSDCREKKKMLGVIVSESENVADLGEWTYMRIQQSCNYLFPTESQMISL